MKANEARKRSESKIDFDSSIEKIYAKIKLVSSWGKTSTSHLCYDKKLSVQITNHMVELGYKVESIELSESVKLKFLW